MIHSDYFNAHSLGNYLSIVRAFAKPGTPAAAAAPLPVDDPRFALGGGRPCVLSESEWTPTIAAVKAKCDALSGTLQATAARPPRLQGAIPCRAGYRPAPHRAAPSRRLRHHRPCCSLTPMFGCNRHRAPWWPVQLVVKGRNLHCIVGAKFGFKSNLPSADVCAESPFKLCLFRVPLPRHLEKGVRTVSVHHACIMRASCVHHAWRACVAGMRGGHAWRACVVGMRACPRT
jgi:hypothetical protein